MFRLILAVVVAFATLSGCAPRSSVALEGKEAMIAEALSAAMPSISENATVVDWEENILREGSNGWTCMPSPPNFEPGSTPMCLDETFVEWADAWANKQPLSIDEVGISYMLKGDAGASNTDPYATEETPDNDWVVSGPHLMLVVPDTAMLEGISDDPDDGGPWVMWKDTPYAHVMIPVE